VVISTWTIPDWSAAAAVTSTAFSMAAAGDTIGSPTGDPIVNRRIRAAAATSAPTPTGTADLGRTHRRLDGRDVGAYAPGVVSSRWSSAAQTVEHVAVAGLTAPGWRLEGIEADSRIHAGLSLAVSGVG
jgi:hypothetical protein